jgi:hypothetical protein
MFDWLLELRIKFAFARFLHAPRSRQRPALDRFYHLVRQRSPRQIARMEKRMGLQ